jgi:hypothetical protein
MKHTFLVVALCGFVSSWQIVPAWHTHDVARQEHPCDAHDQGGPQGHPDHDEQGSHDEEHCPVCRLAFSPLGDAPAVCVKGTDRMRSCSYACSESRATARDTDSRPAWPPGLRLTHPTP